MHGLSNVFPVTLHVLQERGVRYTPALFAREAKYSDGFRSFSGTGPLMRPSWVQDAVRDPKVVRTWGSSLASGGLFGNKQATAPSLQSS